MVTPPADRSPARLLAAALPRRLSTLPLLLAALMLGTMLLPDAPPAQAQSTPAFLVSNLGQLTAGALTTASRVQAQGFTTGSASGGYTLSSIEAVLKTTVSRARRRPPRRQPLSGPPP